MQREDVERTTPERVWLKFLDGTITKGRSNKPMVDGTEFVRTDLYAALLDRAERAEAELADLIHDIERAKEQHTHLLAERDAAFAAGQESMRERAADATLYLCRMKGMGNRTIDGPEAAHLIRALPIKDSPDGR